MANKNNDFEKRTFSFDIRAEERETGETILTGRPIVYEQMTDIGYFNEIIARGALDGANLKDVRFLVNHNTDMIPLARSRRNNGNSTMKFSIDEEGLYLDFVKLDVENNADARALWSAVKRGDISGMSFMFTVDRDEWDYTDEEHPTRRILQFGSVIEVSACTFPAYDDTEINARSLAVLEKARDAMEIAKRQKATAPDGADILALLKAKINLNF